MIRLVPRWLREKLIWFLAEFNTIYLGAGTYRVLNKDGMITILSSQRIIGLDSGPQYVWDWPLPTAEQLYDWFVKNCAKNDQRLIPNLVEKVAGAEICIEGANYLIEIENERRNLHVQEP